MSDEQEKASETKIDPRETPAFKGVVKQLEAERAEKASIAEQMAALKSELDKIRDKDARKELEAKGKYEDAIAQTEKTWAEKYSQLEQQLVQTRAAAERTKLESELGSAGVVGAAREFLATRYLGLAESTRPALGEWIEQAKSDADLSVFFARQKSPQPGDISGRAAASSAGKTDWEQVRRDIRSKDPATSQKAAALMTAYINEHGQPPPR